MSRRNWLISIFVSAAFALTACGGSDSDSPKRGTGGTAGDDGTGGSGGSGGTGGTGGTAGSGGSGGTGGSGGIGEGGTGGEDPITGGKPNILFVIMDDVGIDQMASFGYGGFDPPKMPSIDAVAAGGIRFRNTWSMPECSPGRSALLTGRYPFRNDVNQALGPNDLANSQIDPWEMTVPKVLATAGYESAMFGKFHLAGPEHNEAGNGTPTQLGWDHFYGWTGGLPGSIDTTAGGVAPAGTYSCGFVPGGDEENGADTGACYVPDTEGGASCSVITGADDAGDPPGLQCLTLGGVLVPNEACEEDVPAFVVFDRENAHYVSPLVVNAEGEVERVELRDRRGRGFRSTIEVDAAIEWIKERADGEEPWMVTLSFSSPHTPLQHPPGNLLHPATRDELGPDCGNPLNQRKISNALIEALDTELGRLLVETGIAKPGKGGSLEYDPTASNTVVVIIGDNGSFGPTVKLPFDAFRAKGTAYQTGVWVPLIVAGPKVEAPDRDVEHMVNATDVFRLFAEVADVDVEKVVTRSFDAQPMLPYLQKPTHGSIRTYNFTQGALNIQANRAVNEPCVFNGDLCSHTPTGKSVCEDNGGVWWGAGADDPEVLAPGLKHCWEVNQAIYKDAPALYEFRRVQMGPTIYQAIRDERYKLVRNWALDYDEDADAEIAVETVEFYEVDQAKDPKLDRAANDLLKGHLELNEEQKQRFNRLQAQLDDLLASRVACPGDGNGDGVVDELDLEECERIVKEWGQSSTYDFNLDGVTDEDDLEIVKANQGPCPE